ncbi:hypothetical protein [Ferrimonas senticii]|uniref:hypothetical protein n=1 Tax=Ferrimonas senticii TaxID=394566 RepID=UPI000687BAC9|nr:hypothetical protein [Ferrimonas senticii]
MSDQNVTPPKEWVFLQLTDVQDDSPEIVGLIAYSLYKKQKSNLAVSLRSEGESEVKIQRRLGYFHDDILRDSDRQDELKRRAETLLLETIEHVEAQLRDKVFQPQLQAAQKRNEDLDSKLKRERVRHQEDLKAAGAKAVAEFVEKIADHNVSEKSFGRKGWDWLWNGFAGVVAGALTIGIIYAGSMAMADPDDRNGLIKNFAMEVAGYLAQQPIEDSPKSASTVKDGK